MSILIPPTAFAAPAELARLAGRSRWRSAKLEAALRQAQVEAWKAKDKLTQLAIYLVEKPPPKAEDRLYVEDRTLPLPDVREMRPKDMAPFRIVEPAAELTRDPAFALRREEFEQWLVRRKEAFERKLQAREDAKSIEAKVKARFEARMAREEARGRAFTEAQFKRIRSCLHLDDRKTASDEAVFNAFLLFGDKRDRLVLKDRAKAEAKAKARAATPHPPQDDGPQKGKTGLESAAKEIPRRT